MIKTNLDLFLLGSFIAYSNGWVTAAATTVTSLFIEQPSTAVEDEYASIMYIGEGADYTGYCYAILYPWFTQTIAILIYYVLSRYLQFLPYTAIVFLLGFVLGYGTTQNPHNAIGQSALLWLGINGQVILLVFLPGLIFLDSFTINVHLFFQSFWQLIVFAFPMVLGGTCLTALVAKYIFPYDWSFNLCMTFGAILSSTDPIAVAGLLNALGAPPRLKMHISGESLLNDGSAMVFYNIFSARYFSELEIPGGKDIGWAEGFATFFRLSFGGCAIGLAFGLGAVLLLKMLNRRLSREENVIQVVALISIAYLTYFVADILCLCSGIIATIACGLTIKVLGESIINDGILTLHFFEVTGQLLNTLLFVLGGTLWGNIISNDDALGRYNGTFNGTDWGYLALLFIMLIIIRFVLVFGFYPITARLGIGSNIKEAVFMAYGGFRGSVGIALALSLYARVFDHATAYEQADTLFCMVGGISLFTLLINGITSKPLLQLLGLATPEKIRKKVIANYRKQMVQQALSSYVRLLSQERFKGHDFSLVKEHVPLLRDITFDQLVIAVHWYKNNCPEYLYSTPHLEHVIPYLCHSLPSGEVRITKSDLSPVMHDQVLTHRRASIVRMREHYKWDSVFGSCSSSNYSLDDDDDCACGEARLNFIEILRSAYHHQIEMGALQSYGDLQYSLFQSLDFCEDAAAKGLPLNDWEATKVASATKVGIVDRMFTLFLLRLKQIWRQRKMSCASLIDFDEFEIWMLVRQSLAFVRAHRRAQKQFEEHFASSPLTAAEKKVLDESKTQVMLAQADLDDIDSIDVERITGHMLCTILLNGGVQYVETLSKQGLIPDKDAGEMLEELDECIENVMVCKKFAHEGRLSLAKQVEKLRQLPSNTLDEFNLWNAIEEMSRRSEIEASSSTNLETGDDCLSMSLLE